MPDLFRHPTRKYTLYLCIILPVKLSTWGAKNKFSMTFLSIKSL